jgi:hypothetical protein
MKVDIRKAGFDGQCPRQTPWPESSSELNRQSDRRLSAKKVPTFADKPCGKRDGSLRPYSRFSRPEPQFFSM